MSVTAPVGTVPPAFRATLVALLDRLIPQDESPYAIEAGALAIFDRRAGAEHAGLWPTILEPGLAALDREAQAVHGLVFAALSERDQDALLAAADRGDVASD